MYLSRIQVDTDDHTKIKDLYQLGAYHNWVEQSFPNEISKKERSRKLWRLDKFHGNFYLILLSNEKPDLNKFSIYGIKNTIQIMDYNKILKYLKKYMYAHFKVTLYPKVSKVNHDKKSKRGTIVPCKNYFDQLEYLKNHSKKWGFSLIENQFDVVKKVIQPFYHNNSKRISIQQITYEGQLQITDLETFKKYLCNGMGPRKAYGCGLMTIIPE